MTDLEVHATHATHAAAARHCRRGFLLWQFGNHRFGGDQKAGYRRGILDKDGNHLDGGKSYKLNLPKDPPAEKFMSVVVYDPQTRSQLQTSQPFPSKNNKRDKLIVNSDGSIDLYFGPKAPDGKEANWIQTVPKKGWYLPLAPLQSDRSLV